MLKRDAVAKVVLNNLYKHTPLQDNFGANMLALVDGVPRTLTLDAFIRHWVAHQIEVIVRRTQFRLREAEREIHILRGYLKALDALDAVIALIRAAATVDDAREGLMSFLEVDEVQANAILNLQLRRLAALERKPLGRCGQPVGAARLYAGTEPRRSFRHERLWTLDVRPLVLAARQRCGLSPIDNPYYDPNCDPNTAAFCEPALIPGTPNVTVGMEAFNDTPVVNGAVYPTVTLEPKSYRLRILNAAERPLLEPAMVRGRSHHC